MIKVSVCHVITGLGYGGAERMLFKLLSGLRSGRFRNMVVSLSDRGAFGDRISALGVPVHTLNMRPGVPNPLALAKLVGLLRNFRPELVQTWLPHADLLGTAAAKLALVPRLSWNIRSSDVDYSLYGASTRIAISILARFSRIPDLVIANSTAGRLAHEKLGFSPRRWLIVPNGFDVEHFKPDPTQRAPLRAQLGLDRSALLIGLIARFDAMKDHATALEALRLVPEAHLVAVGRDITPENAALDAPDLRGRLHLLGQRDDVRHILQGVDVATLSSAFGEGFPNALGEAMACSVPCVATDVGDCATIIGDTGRIVPPRNATKLAAAWQALLRMSDNERCDLGTRARQRVIDNWSLPAIVRRYEEAYTQVIS